MEQPVLRVHGMRPCRLRLTFFVCLLVRTTATDLIHEQAAASQTMHSGGCGVEDLYFRTLVLLVAPEGPRVSF